MEDETMIQDYVECWQAMWWLSPNATLFFGAVCVALVVCTFGLPLYVSRKR
jgi:hypothetical protein